MLYFDESYMLFIGKSQTTFYDEVAFHSSCYQLYMKEILMPFKLVYYGNEILKDVAEEVKNIDHKIIDLIDIMFNIMYKEKGIGLAAPQINIQSRIIILDITMSDGPSMALVNPVIIGISDNKESYDEGCLSLPGISADILRPFQVSVKGYTPKGKEVQIDADGLLARVFQHEIDHLNGILFIDHLENYQRKELTSDLKKIKKLNRL